MNEDFKIASAPRPENILVLGGWSDGETGLQDEILYDTSRKLYGVRSTYGGRQEYRMMKRDPLHVPPETSADGASMFSLVVLADATRHLKRIHRKFSRQDFFRRTFQP